MRKQKIFERRGSLLQEAYRQLPTRHLMLSRQHVRLANKRDDKSKSTNSSMRKKTTALLREFARKDISLHMFVTYGLVSMCYGKHSLINVSGHSSGLLSLCKRFLRWFSSILWGLSRCLNSLIGGKWKSLQ